MKIFSSIFFLTITCFDAFAGGNSYSIKGSGSGYENVELRAFVQTDPISRRLRPIAKIKCDDKGRFSFKVDCQANSLICIKAGIFNFRLLADEDSVYELVLQHYIPKSQGEEVNPFFVELDLWPEVMNNKDDVNNLIRNFDAEFNPVFNFVAESVFRNFRKNETGEQISKLDKFKEVKPVPYYYDYVKCRLQMLNLIASTGKQVQTSGNEFINTTFNSENQACTDLAEQMFSGYFNNLASGPLKDQFERAIATASYTELSSVILRDNKIINRELADFVILLNLNKDYYEKNLPGENIRKIISLIKLQGQSASVRNIAAMLLGNINSSLPGNMLHDFSLSDKEGKLMSLKDFRGKYLLLCFVRSDDQPSVSELGIINMWKNKYTKDLQVVTIIMDTNYKTGAESLEKRGFNWISLDGSEKDNLEFSYDLKIYPSFILLDRESKIISDPGRYPSEDLEPTINKLISAEQNSSGSKNR